MENELTVQNFEFSEDIQYEEVRNKHTNSQTVFSDIMTIQCILCIILAIIAVTANILLPKISSDIINEYKSVNDSNFSINSELYTIVNKIHSIINSNAEV